MVIVFIFLRLTRENCFKTIADCFKTIVGCFKTIVGCFKTSSDCFVEGCAFVDGGFLLDVSVIQFIDFLH